MPIRPGLSALPDAPEHVVVPVPSCANLRAAVVGDSGGQGALAADVSAVRGLDVPESPRVRRTRFATVLRPGAGDRNPVDLAGAGEADLGNYARVARVLLLGGDADAVVQRVG